MITYSLTHPFVFTVIADCLLKTKCLFESLVELIIDLCPFQVIT